MRTDDTVRRTMAGTAGTADVADTADTADTVKGDMARPAEPMGRRAMDSCRRSLARRRAPGPHFAQPRPLHALAHSRSHVLSHRLVTDISRWSWPSRSYRSTYLLIAPKICLFGSLEHLTPDIHSMIAIYGRRAAKVLRNCHEAPAVVLPRRTWVCLAMLGCTWSRLAGLALLGSLLHEAVADAPDGHDLIPDRAQLLAQPHDMGIYRAIYTVVVVAPQVLDEKLTAECAARMRGEKQ